MSGPGDATMTGTAALALARRMLAEAGVADPAADARRLLAAATGTDPGRLTLILPEPLDEEAEFFFFQNVALRAERRPLAQVLGGRWFRDHWFEVTNHTLDPRPETELLVDLALGEPFSRVLDLGTGTGCILLSLLAARPEAEGLGVDTSPEALAVARRNAAALGLEARCELAVSDWYRDVSGRFDLIVANPPYIAAGEMAGLEPEVRDWEPRAALTDEGDGLSAYRAIAAGAGAHLAPGGRLIVEIGATQGAAVSEILAASGLTEIAVHPDLNGRDRVVSARNS